MATLKINGDTSGYVELVSPAVAGSTSIALDKILVADNSGNINVTGQIVSNKLFVDGNTIYADSGTNRVGINKTSPATTLDVGGSIFFSSILRSTTGGSESSPSIQPGLDGDTGMFWPATNNIGFSTTGTERMRIDNLGNVGIGADDLWAKMQVEINASGGPGSGSSAGMWLRNGSGSSGQAFNMFWGNSQSAAAGSIALVVDDNANNYGSLEFQTRTPNSGYSTKLAISSDGSVLHKNPAGDASQFIFNSGWSHEARNVRVWGEQDGGVWYSFIGTNVSKDGDGTYTKPSDNAGNNWGNVAGMLLSGANASTQNAIDLVVDLPNAHGNTLNTSMTRNQLFGKSALSITAGGHVTKPMQPTFQANNSGSQSISTDAKISFTSTAFDVGNNFSTTNDRFTAPVSGKYFFNFTASISNMSSTGQYLAVYFRKNGGGTGHRFRTRAEDVGGEWTGIMGTAIMNLSSGDYIEVNAYNHTGNFTMQGGEYFFSGYLIA